MWFFLMGFDEVVNEIWNNGKIGIKGEIWFSKSYKFYNFFLNNGKLVLKIIFVVIWE